MNKEVVEHNGYLLVEVPDVRPKDIGIMNGVLYLLWSYGGKYGEDEYAPDASEYVLPPGQWEIIGKADEIFEWVWDSVVTACSGGIFNDDILGYKNYVMEEQYFNTATASGLSLLKSHGMKPENCLILKLKTNE